MVEHNSIRDAITTLEWLLEGVVPCAAPRIERDAVDAELRAVQRAKRGIVMAESLLKSASNSSLTSATAQLHFQFSIVLRAIFPAGEFVDEFTHDELLAKLESPAFFFQNSVLPVALPTSIVPLSQLVLVEKRKRGDDAASSSGQSSSIGSAWSGSLASFSSVGSDGPTTASFGQLDLGPR